MKFSILILSLFVVLGSSCHTMHLRNGNTYNSNYQTSEMHHIVALRLVEISDPVSPSKVCDKSWDSIRTRTGPLQVFIGLFVGGIYNPEQVSIACRN